MALFVSARRNETAITPSICIICEQTPSDRLNTHKYASMLMAVGNASNPNARMLFAIGVRRYSCYAPLYTFIRYEYNGGKAIL